MDLDFLRNYCLSKNGVTEDFPFDTQTLVFKVQNKIFLLTDIYESPLKFNLKFDPNTIEEWREKYYQITPGYHMNKKHWNTVVCDDHLDFKLILELIDTSYKLVVKGLPKVQRDSLLHN
ncbi:MAG: MmcQ/YjbR family DNA-binding protein [Saprospiraceae bacterium]|jgi:predicted DNA-binding protein (MmcQ/YjbR family)|nr:MmcQ/YjbR family DNA-binding protein [Saprospiraceae bacterium]MBL0294332.1 MmcQ/YjbR family DNA-binding protein [Saprospiraceae bacterium]